MGTLANFGLAISSDAFSNIIESSVSADLMKTLETISADLPPYCCYDDAEVKHVHLMIQNIAMPDSQITVKSSAVTSSTGLTIDVDFQFHFQFFLRLCIHDDPFGHGCSTLFHCKGNVDLIINGNTTLETALQANPTTGLLEFPSPSAKFDLSFPSMAGLCSKGQKGLRDAIPKINERVT